MRTLRAGIAACLLLALVPFAGSARASYTNLKSAHVHPIARRPSGNRLLTVNTPDALLELFVVQPDGSLLPDGSIPVGLEPVTVVGPLAVGDEPTGVVFAGSHTFVAVAEEDVAKRCHLADLDAAPDVIELLTRSVRALAVSADGQAVYPVALRSSNGTTAVNARIIFGGTTFSLSGVP